MTEIDEDVNIPPMPENVTVTVNCSIYKPAQITDRAAAVTNVDLYNLLSSSI